MHDAEIRFIKALHLATERNLISWKVVSDDDRDIFRTDVDGESVEIELIYFEVATGRVYERILARIAGLKTYFHVAVGTEAYSLIASMLSIQIPGWDSGEAGAISKLNRAAERILRLGEKA